MISLLIKGINSDVPPPLNQPGNCNGINTIFADGFCRCKPGFPFGDPNREGCWKCKSECNDNATCTRDNDCACNDFFVGDGVSVCERHRPYALSSYLAEDEKTILVSITDVSWGYPAPAFCRVNDQILEGRLVSENEIECPNNVSGKSKKLIYVSWDSHKWSLQKIKITLQRKRGFNLIYAFLAAIICVTMYLTYVIYAKQLEARKFQAYDEDIINRGSL